MKKETKGLTTRQMILCDACAEYHDEADCEVVIIRIVKGKNCKLTKQPTRAPSIPQPQPHEKHFVQVEPTPYPEPRAGDDGFAGYEVGEASQAKQQAVKPIIPQGILKMMQAPADQALR
jgi:hypothetical protein